MSLTVAEIWGSNTPTGKIKKGPNAKYVGIDTFALSNSFYFLNIQNPFQTSVRFQGLTYLSTANNPQLKIKTYFLWVVKGKEDLFMTCINIKNIE